MRFSTILGVCGLLASTAIASPARCDRYEYRNICKRCPGRNSPRDIGLDPRGDEPEEDDDEDTGEDVSEVPETGLEERNNRICYKDCPREYQECQNYDYSRGPPNYSLNYSQDFQCPKNFKFRVTIKIETCSGGRRGSQCLNVQYQRSGGRVERDEIEVEDGVDAETLQARAQELIDRDENSELEERQSGGSGIEGVNLGVYQTSNPSQYNPSSLNFNSFCQGNRCSVPANRLPNSNNLCGQQIWIAVGTKQCYNNYGRNNNGYRQATKYVKVRISCNRQNNHNRCRSYCCCPRQ